MPAGARAISSFGEGDVSMVRPAEMLNETYFYAGPVKSYPPAGSDTFAMYWLTEPPFDAAQAATMIKRLYDYTAAFFHDEGGSYRVFIRKQPYKGSGGTALYRSFMFGYGTAKTPTVDDIEGLIAHEMVHNWPQLDGDHADTSWFAEGSAEYYSVLLSYRAGLTTPDEFLKRINERAQGYYANPLQGLSNHQADEIYWKDSRAGHVPYGRGFVYLAAVDAQVRAKSHGKRSLDDLELNLIDRRRKGEKLGPDAWEKLVTGELGAAGKRGFEDMVAGKKIVIPAGAFGPCFQVVEAPVTPEDLGFDGAALAGQKKVIKGLEAGSPAALAGLKDGDEVVQAPDVGAPDLDLKKPMTITVRRDGKDTPITFTPAGRPVTGYQWKRNPNVVDKDCKV
jgi:predicted metalloprotease with PDZ domain